jgi:3-phenylpropionate/trans-cinnamate dioxygenase ferredoxin reductase subunit
MTGTLIVGASQAGVQLAASLRELGDTEPIVLLGAEAHPPYQRPPLSKTYLTGDRDPSSLAFRSPDWYRDRAIDLMLGETVTSIDRDAGGGTARTDSGTLIRFDRLALTTGAEPRRLDLAGAEADGVHYLRDTADAERIAADIAVARSIAVIGGGFIGLEVAAGLVAAGASVTVLEAAPRLVGRVVSEETSAFYLDAHRRRGMSIILDARITRIATTRGRAGGVELADGTIVPADVVLIGVGVVPRTALADKLGLNVENGIVVDERAVTSDGVTVAAGDCTIMPTPYVRGTMPTVRLESVHNAVEQAKVAAASLLGVPARYDSVPWFWSDQSDIKLQIAGLSTGYDDIVVRGDAAAESFSVLYYRAGLLIAADSINAPLDHLAVKNALKNGMTVDAARAADDSVPLKRLATQIVVAGVS